MKLENLVVLEYTPNNRFVRVVDVQNFEDKNLIIKLAEDRWSKNRWSWGPFKDVGIGYSRYNENDLLYDQCGVQTSRWQPKRAYSIIGVYDRTDTEHLNRLIDDAEKFMKPDPPNDK